MGFKVPPGICITTDAYDEFTRSQGITKKIQMELARRDPADMRWEELWDASIRIRSLFNHVDLPENLKEKLNQNIEPMKEIPVVVRSSAPGEDGGDNSFAGLHESYVNIRGMDSITEHIKLVWASLWSDRALMYRKELELNPSSSRMSVIIQELITGNVSGVGFSMSPLNTGNAVIEAVRGLNKGLVDGDVSPEQWEIDKITEKITLQQEGDTAMTVAHPLEGTTIQKKNNHGSVVLGKNEVSEIYKILINLEKQLGYAVDVEWTMKDGVFYLLQVRPITTLDNDGGTIKPWEKKDKRNWYKSLTRSYRSLQSLRNRIENELVPSMIAAADKLSVFKLEKLDDTALADEIIRREKIFLEWKDIYWAEFIPFAHGVRLFGQVYNDILGPDDPYSFTLLLTSDEMISVKRNNALENLASMIKRSPADVSSIEKENLENISPQLLEQTESFMENYGNTTYRGQRLFKDRKQLLRLLLSMAKTDKKPKSNNEAKTRQQLEKEYYNAFPPEQKKFSEELLDLGRASWSLRDNDNLYLGNIEAKLTDAIEEGRKRLAKKNEITSNKYNPAETAALLRGQKVHHEKQEETDIDEPRKNDIRIKPSPPVLNLQEGKYKMRIRQHTGQPAGPGIGSGPARVIKNNDDLFEFKEGEIIICDAIDPAMTFVVPLAAGIVERRGGMLIHGAIIAREYGIPCVTGIENATQTFQNGNEVIVDGYLGIVTIREL